MRLVSSTRIESRRPTAHWSPVTESKTAGIGAHDGMVAGAGDDVAGRAVAAVRSDRTGAPSSGRPLARAERHEHARRQHTLGLADVSRFRLSRRLGPNGRRGRFDDRLGGRCERDGFLKDARRFGRHLKLRDAAGETAAISCGIASGTTSSGAGHDLAVSSREAVHATRPSHPAPAVRALPAVPRSRRAPPLKAPVRRS